jgi:hypothetical protein
MGDVKPATTLKALLKPPFKHDGTPPKKGPNQELSEEAVKQAVFAMLDADTERTFWSVLWSV